MTDFRTVCTVQAAASLTSGAALLIVPAPILGLFALPADQGTVLVARILGGVLFALGATLLGVRDVKDRDARVRVMMGNASCDLSVALLVGAASITGALGAAGWALAGLFALNAASWLLALRGR